MSTTQEDRKGKTKIVAQSAPRYIQQAARPSTQAEDHASMRRSATAPVVSGVDHRYLRNALIAPPDRYTMDLQRRNATVGLDSGDPAYGLRKAAIEAGIDKRNNQRINEYNQAVQGGYEKATNSRGQHVTADTERAKGEIQNQGFADKAKIVGEYGLREQQIASDAARYVGEQQAAAQAYQTQAQAKRWEDLKEIDATRYATATDLGKQQVAAAQREAINSDWETKYQQVQAILSADGSIPQDVASGLFAELPRETVAQMDPQDIVGEIAQKWMVQNKGFRPGWLNDKGQPADPGAYNWGEMERVPIGRWKWKQGEERPSWFSQLMDTERGGDIRIPDPTRPGEFIYFRGVSPRLYESVNRTLRDPTADPMYGE